MEFEAEVYTVYNRAVFQEAPPTTGGSACWPAVILNLLFDGIDEFIERQCFVHKAGSAKAKAFLRNRILYGSGHYYDRKRRCWDVCTNTLENLQASQLGKFIIEKNNLRHIVCATFRIHPNGCHIVRRAGAIAKNDNTFFDSGFCQSEKHELFIVRAIFYDQYFPIILRHREEYPQI